MPEPSAVGTLARLGRFLEIQNLGLNLPFIVACLLVAGKGHPTLPVSVLVILAFVAARNAGHSFNRWADRDLDAANPRTQERLLVTRPELSRAALLFAAGNAVLLGVCAYLLSPLAFALVPVAVALVLVYSYTKRLTSWTTVFLGLVEGIGPAGVYAGVTNTLPAAGLVISGAMLAWGTAFETIHSLGDLGSDTRLKLRSIPTRLGVPTSLRIMTGAHAVAFGLFVGFGLLVPLGAGYFLGLVPMAALVGYIELGMYRHPDRTRGPFELHFVLAALFLVAVLLGLYLVLPPWG